MKRNSFFVLILVALSFVINETCIALTVRASITNKTYSRGLCQYQLSNGAYSVTKWSIDTSACVATTPQGTPDPTGFSYDVLYVKWRNIEANAGVQLVFASWSHLGLTGVTDAISVGPFTLNMPTPTFNCGTTFNIPCYLTTGVTISLNPYINTGSASIGIDQNRTISSSFEWTLPSGWQTTSGQMGTFVSASSIIVIPPASSSPASIKVRAKANTQYSPIATLQITRNLDNFTIAGQSPVLCNTSNRYTAPVATGVSYSWQLPAGWTGTSTTNYIDVVAKGASGSISCTMTGCNGPKSSSKSIVVDLSNPGISISGPSIVCSSGATFTINTPPAGSTILWTKSSNLAEVSGQGTTVYTVRAWGGGVEKFVTDSSSAVIPPVAEEPGSSGSVQAIISNSCGSIPIPQKIVWAGFPGFRPVVTGPTSINCGSPQIYLEQNHQSIYWSVPGSMQIIGSAGPGYRCTIKGLELAASGVIGTVSNGCGSFTDILEVDINCSTLTLYPNPASSSIDVTIASDVTDTGASLAKSTTPIYDSVTYIVRITNNYGIPFYTTQRTGNCFTIPVDNLKDGIYIVQVTDGDNVYSQQLIVKH